MHVHVVYHIFCDLKQLSDKDDLLNLVYVNKMFKYVFKFTLIFLSEVIM